MTKEEFRKLKPGDKIYVAYKDNILENNEDGAEGLDIFHSVQERNGGYLIVEKEPEKNILKDDFLVEVKEVKDWILFAEDIELYEEPNRPWSYEKDY